HSRSLHRVNKRSHRGCPRRLFRGIRPAGIARQWYLETQTPISRSAWTSPLLLTRLVWRPETACWSSLLPKCSSLAYPSIQLPQGKGLRFHHGFVPSFSLYQDSSPPPDARSSIAPRLAFS